MSVLEQALYTRLTGYAGLSALVSSRIYADRLPQNPTLPALTYQRISREPWESLSASDGVEDAGIQIDVWASTVSSRSSVTVQVLAALKRQTWTEDGIAVLDAFIESDITQFDPDVSLYRETLDMKVVHRE